MVKKVSRFGIRTGTFNCSSDPRYEYKGLSRMFKAELYSGSWASCVVKAAVIEGAFIYIFAKVSSEFSAALFISIINTGLQLPKALWGKYMMRPCRASYSSGREWVEESGLRALMDRNCLLRMQLNIAHIRELWVAEMLFCYLERRNTGEHKASKQFLLLRIIAVLFLDKYVHASIWTWTHPLSADGALCKMLCCLHMISNEEEKQSQRSY